VGLVLTARRNASDGGGGKSKRFLRFLGSRSGGQNRLGAPVANPLGDNPGQGARSMYSGRPLGSAEPMN